MVIAVDIGNSNISLALWNNKAWSAIYRIDSRKMQNKTLCTSILNNLLEAIDIQAIEVTIISSVVPTLTPMLAQCLANMVPCKIIYASTDCPSPLVGNIPKELGQDLFANAVAGYCKSNNITTATMQSGTHSLPTTMASIVIDMGTALTFIAVRAKGTIAGVAISTGLETSYKALVGRTAQISELTLTMPSSALGNDTQSALNSGIVLGFAHLIFGMIGQIKEELQEPCKIYATGGLSETMSPLLTSISNVFDNISVYHTLDGLRILAEYHRSSN